MVVLVAFGGGSGGEVCGGDGGLRGLGTVLIKSACTTGTGTSRSIKYKKFLILGGRNSAGVGCSDGAAVGI